MLRLQSIDLRKQAVANLVIPVCEDAAVHHNRRINNLARKALALDEFSGQTGQTVVFYAPPRLQVARVVFMGLGKAADVDTEALRALAGKAAQNAIRDRQTDLTLAVPAAKKLKLATESLLTAVMEGAVLGNHLFDRYRREKKDKPLKQVQLMVKDSQVEPFRHLEKRVETICRAAMQAREWVSTPSNDKRPEQFASLLSSNARKMPALKTTVMTDKSLVRQKFGALLAVGAGSENKPRLVVMEYNAAGATKTVALVGKGVTFDTGGINLKSSAGIADMKGDMAGAAAVAATMLAVAELKPGVNVVGLMPLVENMPSGSATRPGDVVKSYEGKTVEIGNTDAEGRLILIDAMAYAVQKYKPDTMLDLATLTGACVVALGESYAAVFSDHDDLAQKVVEAGQKTFERCWRLPLVKDYKEGLKSPVADLSNIGATRWGGAITAALFLSEFVGETRWAHLDIAGPAYSKKGHDYCPPGGTGFGVRLLCELLKDEQL